MSSPNPFVVHHDAFRAILGKGPTLDLLAEKSYPFAHEAGIFIAPRNELVQITRVHLDHAGPSGPVTCEEISAPVPMANGGINYKDGIIICAQGSMEAPTTSTAGRPFNSVNDVVVHSDGTIWFTDPIYEYEQGYRPAPRLPKQVYRFNPVDGSIRAMADGFGRPNGICFSLDEKVVYVTDTDWLHGDGTTDDTRPSSIYAFDVVSYHGQPFLTNRRLFAIADTTIPDGIKCGMNGNLLGRILVEEGIANFCFGAQGEMFLLNENRLWRAKLKGNIKGALLGL
ncbi:hypothetical protein BJX63DRAFT_417807 [Aspergillus granulosus]|uniref:SMP-30/Gluconolactonase/LRE-like region domain-containing protein n=1 Tax=Aspergillus granulosus TaxID=176169 RepID=A0ABR4I2Q7_9EURO